MRAELLGVRLRGAAPMRDVEVLLQPGMTVLAGLNGAGKTRVLEGVRCALEGGSWHGGDYEVLVRLVDGDASGSGLEDTLAAALATAAGDRPAGADSPQNLWRVNLREALRQRGFGDDLGRELTEGALLALSPNGLWVAADRGSEAPQVRAMFEYFDEGWAQAREQVEELWSGEPDQGGGPFGWYDVPPFLDGVVEVGYDDVVPPHWGVQLPVAVLRLGPGPRGWPLSATDVDTTTRVDLATRSAIRRSVTDSDDVLYYLGGEETPPRELIGRGPIGRLARALGLAGTEAFEASMDPAVWARVVEDAEWGLRGPLAEARLLSDRANAWLRRLLPDGPRLTCQVAPVAEWLGDDPVRWTATDTASRAEVPLEALSASQRRWAVFAVGLALSTRVLLPHLPDREPLQGWLVVDEPEAGVHRAAERQLAGSLAAISREEGVGVVAASHSPDMVAAAHHVLVVRRDGSGDVTVAPMAAGLPEAAAEVGVPVTDLLGWYRQVLLVEGAHDEAVVRTVLDEVLVATRTLVVPLRGVRGASAAVDSRLLTTFSEARLVLLVDGMGTRADEAWTQVQAAAAVDERRARRLLAELFAGDSWESAFLRDAGEVLLGRGRLGEVSVVALSVGDVIELLPPGAFVPGATDWAPLRADHAAEVAAARREHRPARDFKTWLRDTRSATVGVRRVTHAAQQLDDLPEDLVRLVQVLSERSGGWDA